MRIISLLGPTAADFAVIIQILTFLKVAPAHGLDFNPVTPPNLDLSELGRVALTGDFDAISLYSYEQQSEASHNTNGSQSIVTQRPNGDFAITVTSDGYIKSMCPFVMKDGTLAGVIVGGNFTSMGGQEAQGVALYDPNTQNITALTGLTGNVETVWCDQDTNTVYVGGDFKGGQSTNAIAWVGMAGWSDLPFSGFDGPVHDIRGSPNGTIIFAGMFTGLGNATTPKQKDQLVINLSSAEVTAESSSTTAGFSDPRNIVCKTDGQDAAGSTWLLEDNKPGFWKANLSFGFQPTMLRLWNTRHDGRGTDIFRFTALEINGIMNFTYIDPATGNNRTCDARCPLPHDPKVPFQDFHFVNQVGMSSFQIDISAWHGQGGGLNGIELFQDGETDVGEYFFANTNWSADIYAFAVKELNEPACAKTDFPSNASSTGSWRETPSGLSNSKYLTADLDGPNANPKELAVTFQPDIKQAGNYSVTIYTPGCIQDNSCDNRGIVNVTWTLSSQTQSAQPQQTTIYQTNYYDKYDQLYFGPVDASSASFRPSVTLRPATNQREGISIVAQRVRFILTNSTLGLNGLFEFDPNEATIDAGFANSTVNKAGTILNPGATFNGLAVLDSVIYAGGNLSAPGIANIISINDGNASALPGAGLNAEVTDLFAFEDLLFVAGNFTGTANDTAPGMNNIVIFNSSSQAWQTVGAGVNGRVDSIVAVDLNITANVPETCIALSGVFDKINAFESNPAIQVSGFAIWVPSHQNWQQNLATQSMAIDGYLSASTNVTGSTPLLSGSISSQDINAGDAVSLTSSPLRINSLGVKIQPQQPSDSSKSKRAVSGVSGQNTTGAVTGLFYNVGNTNITVIGGHFTATASNGSTVNNLVFLNSTGTITGLEKGIDAESVFLALATQDTLLYAGGTVTGKIDKDDVNGLILYDLVQANYASSQPAPFKGSNVAVNAITTRPNTQQVYVGGSFDSAGDLPCPGVCMLENQQWNQPGFDLKGSVAALAWQGDSKLLAGGNLTISGTATSLASYDAKKSEWSALDGAANDVPGPVTALSPANDDASQFWVAGKATNGSSFLMKYGNSKFKAIGQELGPETTIRGLSMIKLSEEHDSSDLVDRKMMLLITGQLVLPDFGNASAALFNGTNFSPFLLSTSRNSPGSISQLFSERVISFKNTGKFLNLVSPTTVS